MSFGKTVIIVAVVLVVGWLALPQLRNAATGLIRPSEDVTVRLRGGAGPDASRLDTGDPPFQLITVLGFDAIPAILEPEFVTADVAEQWMQPDEQVLGLTINGESKAYSIPFLSRHEIVNDVVGGVPVAVTW